MPSDSEHAFWKALEQLIAQSRAALARIRTASGSSEPKPATAELIEELSQTLEELEVTAEKLEQQNQKLRGAAEQIAAEQRRYRELFELAPDAYLVTDPNGMIREANRRARQVLSSEQPVGTPLAAYVGDGAVGEAHRRIRRLGGDVARDDWDMVLSPSGRPKIVVHVEVTRGTDPDGTSVLRWVLHDVTDSRRAQERLEAAYVRAREDVAHLRDVEDWKNIMLSAAAHDLRAPLSIIQLAAETALDQDDGLTSAQVRDLLERIHDNATRTQALLDNLLDLDRLTRGVIRADREPVRLDELIVDAVESTPLGDHPVATDLGPLTANVDPGQLRQVFVNLLSNAVQHTPAGTPIEVVLRADGTQAVLSVADTGPGLPDDLGGDMFAPFATSPRHEDDTGGTGIGLSLVQLFTDLHDGTVRAEDRSDGGARFTVELPDCLEPPSE